MWETQVQPLGQENLLEKEMAPHSSILAWKIPWMEEPGPPWGRKELDMTERLHFTSHYTELGLSGKESTCDAGDTGLIPESGRSPGGGHGNPLLYSCLEHPTDRGAW